MVGGGERERPGAVDCKVAWRGGSIRWPEEGLLDLYNELALGAGSSKTARARAVTIEDGSMQHGRVPSTRWHRRLRSPSKQQTSGRFLSQEQEEQAIAVWNASR